MKRTWSFKQVQGILWAVMIVALAAIMTILSTIFYRNSRQEYLHTVNSMAENYASDFDRDIGSLKKLVDSIYINDGSFYRLLRPGASEFEWFGATYHLQNTLESAAGSLDFMGGLFVYDAEKHSMRSRYSSYPAAAETGELNQALRDALCAFPDKKRNIQIYFQCRSEDYYIYGWRTRNIYLGYIINLSRYNYEKLESTQGLAFVQNGTLLTHTPDISFDCSEAANCWESQDATIEKDGIAYSAKPISLPDMQMVFFQKSGVRTSLWKQTDFWFFLLLSAMVIVAVMYSFNRLIQWSMFTPVMHLAKRLQAMKEGEDKQQDSAQPSRVHIAEIDRINEQMNAMLDEIHSLQDRQYQEKMRADHAQLQYYQLQINPHFYLNCMNTVSTLIEDGRTAEARDLIYALSSHFRYVFRDRKTLVPLAEEMKEVRDYCNIYTIKGGFPILLEGKVSAEAEKTGVPILAIETFVENSIKHVKKNGFILRIIVQAECVQNEEGKNLTRIRISDNGAGYPENVLADLNREVTDFAYSSQHVGIDNVRYRLSLLYGDRANIYFYNAPFGGAVTEMTVPGAEYESSDY